MNLSLLKTYSKFLFFAILFSFSITSWSQTATITIDLTSAGGSTNLGNNNYNSGAERTWTQDGVSFGSKATTAAPSPNTGAIQAQASNGVVYNTTALPGRLVSVVITSWSGTTNRPSTLFVGDSGRLVNATTANYNATGTSLGASTPGSWTVSSGDYTYFAIKRGANAAQWSQIVITYETAPVGPTVTTTAASAISTTGADLNGTINANGTTTDASFEYGTTVVYGNTATATPSSATGTSDTSISATIGSLAVNTLYHFRAVGTVSAVPTNGADLTFYTLAATPGVLAISNPQFTTLDVTVNATTENGNPASTEYAIQETGGQYVQANGSLGATAVWQTAATWATTSVTGLTASTTYTFQVKARNGANVETSFGATSSGTTLAPQTADYNVVQFPNTTQNITEGTSFTVYIRAYEDGITNLAGSSPRLKGWVGYSSTNDNPANAGWTWIPATFNVQVGNDDEYQANIPGTLTPGTYYYAARFEIDDSTVYTYGGSSGNWNNDNVTLNVNADVVNFANIQFPTTATITEGETVTIFAQVYEPGITEGAGQGAGITAEIGYSSADTTPDGTWTWLSATHNASVTGNNDEYQVNLGTGLTPGTYYYASRFIKTGSSTYVYGGTAGIWNNDSGVLTVNALGTPVATAGTLIGQTEFTANWNAVAGATSYEIDVYEQTTIFATDLFISEYVEGSSNNKYIEIFNGTGASVDLADYELRAYNNGSATPNNTNLLSGTLENNATIVYSNAAALIYGGATTDATAVGFNGDDAVALYKISTTSFVDVFGRIGNDPGTQWTGAGGYSTLDKTLVRKSNVIGGVTVSPTGTGVSAFTTLTTEWDLFDLDTVTNLGSHTFNGGSSTTYVIEDLNVGAVTSYEVTGLNPETTYFYIVRAVVGAVTSPNSNEIEVETKPTTVTWNGTEWSNIDGPDATIDAIIAGAYATGTDGEFTAKKLTVTSGSLTVNSGTSITVEDVLENELTAAEVVVENNANLIQSNDVTNIGSITVQRNSAEIMRLDYTLWSSPVVGQNLLGFSPQTMANRFYVYNPGNNQYAAIIPSTNDFIEGNGYLIRAADNHPTSPTTWAGTFVGEPNNGNVTVSVANNTYNAVGNPYPSTISADDFIGENGLTEALYFWRKTNAAAGSAYATYTLAGGAGTGSSGSNAQVPNGTIQVGQGFIARATSTSLVFTNQMRTANQANQFFRSENENRSRIWLNLNDAENLVGQTMIAYMEGTTTEVDAKYDGKYINDSQTAFTSLINNEEFAVQARGEFISTDVVPMSIKIENAGAYSISLAQVDGLFTTENDIYLRDSITGEEHDLRNAAYNFTIDSGVFNNRFELIYQSALSVENPTFSNVLITTKNKIIEINSGNELIQEVKVFDMRGRLLAQQSNVNASSASLTLAEVASQVLIVQITSDNGKVTSRKVVH